MRLALCENGGHPSFLLQKYLPDKRQILRLWIAFCAILCYNFGRTEQKTAGAFRHFAPPGGGRNVKREAGVNPARSRHCDKGVRVRVLCAPATGALLREGDAGRRSFSQETCLLLVRGPEPQITRNWLYQKALKQQRSFCHAIRRTKGPLFYLTFLYPLFGSAAIYPQERTRQ